jgi:hypothetical protein
VIEPRVEEIFSLVQQVMRESGYEEVLSSGIVITGGSAVMPGMVELGEDIFLKPVRRGVPRYRGALADMIAPAARRHRDGPAGRSAPGAHARLQGRAAARLGEDRLRPHQGFHRGELLMPCPQALAGARFSPTWQKGAMSVHRSTVPR